jgi:hypothetical protein
MGLVPVVLKIGLKRIHLPVLSHRACAGGFKNRFKSNAFADL